MSRRHIAPLLILLHALLLWHFFSPATSTPDAHSYFNQAKTLARGASLAVVRESPAQYIGVHYAEGPGGRFDCKHAPGLSLLMALPYRLISPRSALAVNPALTVLSLLGLWLLARRWVGRRWAWLPVALAAVNPAMNEHAFFGDAHAAAACLLVWTLYCLERPRSTGIGFAAGLLAGMIPMVRYGEALYVPALAWYGASRRRLSSFAVGAAIPLLLLCLRNQAAYGAFWRTGYSLSGEQTAFSLASLLRNGPGFLMMLIIEGGGLTFLLGAAALARKAPRRRALLMLAIAVPTTLLYMSYRWPVDPQSMRFLIPTLYLYALASAWLLRGWGRRARAAALILVLLHALWGLPRSLRAMGMMHMQQEALVEAADTLTRTMPEGSVLIAPGSLNQYLDGLGRWRLADRDLMTGNPPSPPPGLPALPPPPLLRRDPYRGMPDAERLKAFRSDVWAWAGNDRRVYCLTDEEPGMAGIARLILPGGPGSMLGPAGGVWVLTEWAH